MARFTQLYSSQCQDGGILFLSRTAQTSILSPDPPSLSLIVSHSKPFLIMIKENKNSKYFFLL